MNNTLRIAMVLLTMCVLTGSMRGQSTSSSASQPTAADGTGETDAQQTGTEDTLQHMSSEPAEDISLSTNKEPAPVYVSALDGTGLISQNEAQRGRFLIGANVSGGYDTNPTGLENAPKSGVFLLSPFLGLQGNSPNLHYVVQYLPTFSRFTSSSYDPGSMHLGSADIAGHLNERWNWYGDVLGRHGLQSISQSAPQQSVPIGDVPGTAPGGNVFNPNLNTITSVDGRAGLSYLLSERSTLGFMAENSYTSYNTLTGNSLIGTASTAYMYSATPALQWIAYGSATRYYGFVHCYAFGGEAGLEWKPEEHTYLHLTGGPQVDTSGCGKQQEFSYQAAYSHRVTQRSQIYVTSSREAGSTDLGPGLWQQTDSIGYQRDFGRRETIAFDFGYVSTTGLQKSDDYSGKYVDGIYTHILGHGLRAIFSYRWYAGDTSQFNFTRTTALLSIAWAPTAGHLFQ
jgi:hypothetical protein